MLKLNSPSSFLRLSPSPSRSAHSRLQRGAAVLGLALAAGCGVDGGDETYGETTSAVTVASYQTSGCSTSVVIGLSKQISDEIACMSPGSLVKFASTANLTFTSSAVLPYLHSGARTDLLAVAASRKVQVNSAFRTVAQQYLLYRWYQLGRCGITAAATPGRSNHQSGRALDLQNYSALISPMAARGWTHNVPNDPVHFDHPSSPDIRGKDVLAFQRLWNRNNPNDKIAEDGDYGPQTEARLKKSEATGFAKGATCATTAVTAADVVMVEGPDRAAPNSLVTFAFTVANRTETDWPATTRLRVAGGEASPLYDPASWSSATDAGDIGGDIGAGAQGVIELTVRTPDVNDETPFHTQLELADGTGATIGTIDVALTVTPNGDEDMSNEGGDTHDAPETTGGCSAAGGTGAALAPMLLALVALRRRRRATPR